MCETVVRWQARLVKLRTSLTGLDPGLNRLRLAAIATASMVLAAGVMAGVQALTGQSVTVVLFAAVLAMISNLAVNEPDLGQLRVTTLLMLAPAVALIATGTLLAPHRVVADVVFIVVMVIAVYIRRFGPRGFALGMAAFMPFFFTQFLQASVDQLPWLLVAAAIGIGSTLLLRGWVFAERPERTLERLVRAFRAHLHALVEAVADLLAAPPEAVEGKLRNVLRRRTRLNETALLVADRVEQRDLDHRADADEGDGADIALRILDAELAAERLAVATRRLVQGDTPMDDGSRRALLAGLHALGAASATGTPPGTVTTLLDGAKRSVGALVAETGGLGDRTQRVAFAVARLAVAMDTAQRSDEPILCDSAPQARTGGGPDPDDPPGGLSAAGDREPDREPDRAGDREPDRDGETDTGADTAEPEGLRLSTRQAVQVGVATSLAIVVGELVSPSRWYWAVIAAFVGSPAPVAAVTCCTAARSASSARSAACSPAWAWRSSSRPRVAGPAGDVRLRVPRAVPGPVSQTLMAFWITAVLALSCTG